MTRRFRFQFSLAALLGLVTVVAIGLTVYLLFRTVPPEPPARLPFVKVVKTDTASMTGSLTSNDIFVSLYFSWGSGRGSRQFESYIDRYPYATANAADITRVSSGGRFNEGRFSFDENVLNTPGAARAGYMPPELLARYQQIWAAVNEQVNIDEIPWGETRFIELPEDFPTLEEFLATHPAAAPIVAD